MSFNTEHIFLLNPLAAKAFSTSHAEELYKFLKKMQYIINNYNYGLFIDGYVKLYIISKGN